MTPRVEQAIDRVITNEGGYVDHPNDRGGPTMYGITVGVAKDNGYFGSMQNLPMETARRIYRQRFVTVPWFDRVLAMSVPIGEELVDTGVNMGPGRASLFFQEWLNGFNLRGRIFPDLFVDGRIGKQTMLALNAYLNFRGDEGEDVMVAALNSSQGSFYLGLAKSDQTQEDFLYGWIRTRVLGLT
jgi:lysozyme family protein